MTGQVIRLRKELGKTVASDVAYRLREEIVSCRLQPGEPLKFENLRALFGASFTTLREALTSLAADGLVIAEEQRGFRVAPATEADLIDVTNARVLIEVETFRKAILNGDDEWEIGLVAAMHRLNKVESKLEGPVGENLQWRSAHAEFHFALVSACGSPTLLAMRHSLFDRSERYRSLSAAFRPESRDKSGEHRELMLAAVNREGDRAATLIERHIRNTAENVLKYGGRLLEPIQA